MSGASHKKKLTKYTVTVERTVVFQATVEIEARNLDEAADTASNAADCAEPHTLSITGATDPLWSNGMVIGGCAKARLVR